LIIDESQISLSLHWEREKALPQIDYASEKGYGLEISTFTWAPLYNDEGLLDKKITEMKVDLEFFGNKLSLHGPIEDVISHSGDEAIREIARKRVARAIGIAKELKATRVIYHSGINTTITSPVYYEDTKKRQAAFWRQIAEENHDIQIFIENMWEKTPDMLVEIVESSNRDNLRLCFDPAHMNIYGDATITDWLEKASSYTCHYHLNDNEGNWDQHLAVGNGTVNWTEFKKFPQNADKNCYVIELEDLEEQKASISFLLN